MFDTLLESRARRRRRPVVVAASAAAHAVMIAVVVWATAGAEPGPERPRDADITYLPVPERPPEPAVAPPRPASPSTPSAPSDAPALPVIDVPVDVPVGIPDVDPTRVLPSGDAFEKGLGAILRPGGGPPGGGTGPSLASGDAPVDRASVDREVVPRADNPPPRYPDVLRSAGVEGGVSVRFVVDTLGRVEPASVQVVQTDHAMFADAVRAALGRARFTPAELQGRRVRQLVEQRFGFVIER